MALKCLCLTAVVVAAAAVAAGVIRYPFSMFVLYDVCVWSAVGAGPISVPPCIRLRLRRR